MPQKRIVLHIPHACPILPFGLSGWDEGILHEIVRWTDWYTDWLFVPSSGPDSRIIPVTYPFSRFFCDVERLENDATDYLADVEFHVNLAYASHNTIFAAMLDYVNSLILELRMRFFEREDYHGKTAEAHRRIYEAKRRKQLEHRILWGRELEESIQRYLSAGKCLRTAKILAGRDFRKAHPQDTDSDAVPGHSGPALRRYLRAYRQNNKP